MNIVDSFRFLRRAWFHDQLRYRVHEREWETEEQELSRNNENRKLMEMFDVQTELIISGSSDLVPIAPRCAADLHKYKSHIKNAKT